MQQSRRGEYLKSESFKDHAGNKFAHEEVTRAGTKDIYQTGLEAKIKHLQRRREELENEPGSEIQLKHVQRAQERAEASLSEVQKLNGTWASTNAPRWLFIRAHQEAKNLGLDEQEALMKGREIAKSNYVPLLGNSRNQKIFVEGKEAQSTNRSAALSDFSNNETNLTEMKDLKTLQGYFENPKGSLPEEQRLASYYNLISSDNIDIIKVKAAIDKIRANVIEAYGEGILNANGSIDMAKLDEKIEERKERLDSLFLQDLVLHHKSGHGMSGGVFRYARQSLVNTNAGSNKGEGGLILNERNQALDTRAAVLENNGKTIVYDTNLVGDAAFIDPETGNIHLSAALKPKGAGESITLQTRFSNISVAVDTKNTGLQAHINRECLAQSKQDLQELKKNPNPRAQEAYAKGSKLCEKLEEMLNAGKGGFDVAEKMMLLLGLQNNLSVNCYGGKDRTGYALALISYNKMKQHLKTRIADKRVLSSMMERIGKELVSQNSIALQVVEDNTGFRAIKLMAFDLKLYFGKKKVNFITKALVDRVVDYGRVLAAFLPQDLAAKMGEGAIYSEFNIVAETEALPESSNLRHSAPI